jgi:hypothetical protein
MKDDDAGRSQIQGVDEDSLPAEVRYQCGLALWQVYGVWRVAEKLEDRTEVTNSSEGHAVVITEDVDNFALVVVLGERRTEDTLRCGHISKHDSCKRNGPTRFRRTTATTTFTALRVFFFQVRYTLQACCR